MKKIINYKDKAQKLICISCIVSLFLFGCMYETVDKEFRADIVIIDNMNQFDDLDRPPVQFPHDKHTEAIINKNTDCDKCHKKQKNGKLSQKFMRLDNPDKDTVMEIYHDNCITCHWDRLNKDLDAGPVTCGACHSHEDRYISSRQPFGFDKSLHYRHIKEHKEKCEKCHHQYDKKKEKLYYKKGDESSCRDCHAKQTKDDVRSLRLAVHEDCIGCHRKKIEQDKKAKSPQECSGCHDLLLQKKIKTIPSPPRLKRNQPNFSLLSALKSDIKNSKINTVPFSHIGHEKSQSDCRTCHRGNLLSCNKCHSISGDNKKGAGISLHGAMHDFAHDLSCVGCHESEKNKKNCSGCHSMMQQAHLSERSCNICHSGPSPKKLKGMIGKIKSIKAFYPNPSKAKLSFSKKNIPKNVEISILSKKYKAVKFPHQKIIKKLLKHINKSKLATYFHQNEDLVCQGCHHNSPVGEKPPLCTSCHNKPFDLAELLKPGLLGAYHRMCISCHEEMRLEKPTGCEGCHEKK
jgi:hypothetical protein